MGNNLQDNMPEDAIYDYKEDQIYTKDGIIKGLKRFNTTTFMPFSGSKFRTTENLTIDDTLFKKYTGKFNVKAACTWLHNNSYDHYIKNKCGKCAKFVRMAIEAGGISTIGRPIWAWKYVDYLPTIGFKHLCSVTRAQESNFKAEPGDIAVYQKGGNPNVPGHICMFTGVKWTSDFKQNSMFVYQSTNTAHIYRFVS